MSVTRNDDYHALLARHDAMRLRRRLLAPAPQPPEPLPYDGAADQRLIAAHLHLVTPLDELIAHLYEVMFRRRPALRSLFPDSMAFQQEHLEAAFRHLIEHLHRPDEVAATFRQLGRDHRKLGVRPAHYASFEEALREALRRCAGPQWPAEAEQAWLRMLRFAVGAMTDGADAALAEPPCWQALVVGHERRRPDLAVLHLRTSEPYPYRAGQHGALESPLLPRAWRQYSMAGAPRPDDVLEFHVRRTGPGGVSEALVERTGVGDVLRLGPAGGKATLDADLSRDVLLVAGGTGLAQAKALVQELAARPQPPHTARLFVGARTRSDLYDLEWLGELQQRRPWLRVVPVVGDIAEAVGRHGGWSEYVAYVSGPPAMVRATARRLTGLGLPAARIRHDALPEAGRIG